jgi:hypothetical protein
LIIRRSARYAGHVDAFTIVRARGWAIDRCAPDRPASIAVLVRGRVVAIGAAAQHRPDAAGRGFPSAHCGFDIALDLPPKDIASGDVSVAFWENGRSVHELSRTDPAFGASAATPILSRPRQTLLDLGAIDTRFDRIAVGAGADAARRRSARFKRVKP